MSYTLCDNVVLKDGEEVGAITDGVLSTPRPLAGPTKGAIKKALSLPDLKFAVSADGDEQEEDRRIDATPPRPPNNPDLGDHCPALQAWRKEHAPEEWADYLERFPNLNLLRE